MTALVGAIGPRNVTPLLVEGLRRVQRAHDSAGLALLNPDGRSLSVERCVGGVGDLEQRLAGLSALSRAGIAHTRNASRGEPSERNAHPQVSGDIAVVHNGDFDNYRTVRAMLEAKGYEFRSDTDTEVAAHLIHHLHRKGGGLFQAVHSAIPLLDGVYALAVVAGSDPDCLVAAHHGSPLIIGATADGRVVASDSAALMPWTRRCLVLEDGDVAELRREHVRILDRRGIVARRLLRSLRPAARAG